MHPQTLILTHFRKIQPELTVKENKVKEIGKFLRNKYNDKIECSNNSLVHSKPHISLNKNSYVDHTMKIMVEASNAEMAKFK